MKTEKTTQLELTGNSHISLAVFAAIVSLTIMVTHAGTTYIDVLLKGVH
jgi:hypothetical protein